MRQILKIAPAIALIIIGLTKMVLQANAQDTLLIPTCLGKTITLTSGVSPWSVLHCWGCYAVLAGLAYLALSLAMNRMGVKHASI